MKKTDKSIYVLHEYGAPIHYTALIELAKENEINVHFRIFSPKAICKQLLIGNIKEALSSICFLLTLPFRKQTKIILGIAPFNRLLYPLSFLLKRHLIFYHTSFTCWDGTYMAHHTNSKKIVDFWKNFITQKVSYIFAVSEKCKSELIKNNFANKNNISIVNHSYSEHIKTHHRIKDNSFIFVGRLTAVKGILELITFFRNHPEATLTIVGKGDLKSEVEEASKTYHNIKYLGYIKGIKNIIPLYQANSFLVMNSKRKNNWEELFGISIIEGMASGCVPIVTDHSGPKEIITNNLNGLISSEDSFEDSILQAIQMKDETYQILREQAIIRGMSYQSSNMKSKWQKIL